MNALVWIHMALGLAAANVIPAFPGAAGFGAETPGGRGGKVLFVTTLADSGSGSLRAACEAKGPRIVLFRIGGRIDLKSPLRITEPYLTIAGQSAPGSGVCIAQYGCVVDSHDVVLRHLRFRPGDLQKKELDALSVTRSKNVVVDHCSASWAIDETLSVTNSSNVTVQWCMITESLNQSHHKKGAHGYGSLITGPSGGISFHHNLYAQHQSRSPRPGAPKDTEGVVFDFRNNVVYDWGGTPGYNSESPLRMNYVGNYLRPGPSTKDGRKMIAFVVGGDKTRIYLKGNVHEANEAGSADNVLLLMLTKNFAFAAGYTPKDSLESQPFPAPAPKEESATTSLDRVLRDAGATAPLRDAVDARIALEVREKKGGIINSQSDVGGWPEYLSAAPAVDVDDDGMADLWEKRFEFDPKDSKDGSDDADGDGYSNLEEFLNGADPRQTDRE